MGISASETSASSQLRRNIATTVAITVVTVDMTDVAVEVSTLSTPPMSLLMRLCTSPVRVLVKNASESRCRCRKTRGTQVVHHPLPHLGRDVRLNDTDRAGPDRDRDHPPDQLAEPAEIDVPALDGIAKRLDHRAQQEGRHDPWQPTKRRSGAPRR